MEDLAADEKLLDEGKVDLVPAADVDPAVRDAARAASAARAAAARTVPIPGGGSCAVTTDREFVTNGGMMYDIRVAFDSAETGHRIVVGRRFFEGARASPEAALDATLAFLISTGVSLRSEEGMTAVSGFNPGYFSLTEIEQTFDGFADHLLAAGLTTAKDDGVWQFKRVHEYGDGRVAAPAWGGLREEEEAVIV